MVGCLVPEAIAEYSVRHSKLHEGPGTSELFRSRSMVNEKLAKRFPKIRLGTMLVYPF